MTEVYEIPNTFSRRPLDEQIAEGSCDWVAEDSARPNLRAYGHTEAEARANFVAVCRAALNVS